MYLFLFGMEKGVFQERRCYGSEWFEHCMVPSDHSVCFFTSVRSSSMCHYIWTEVVDLDHMLSRSHWPYIACSCTLRPGLYSVVCKIYDPTACHKILHWFPEHLLLTWYLGCWQDLKTCFLLNVFPFNSGSGAGPRQASHMPWILKGAFASLPSKIEAPVWKPWWGSSWFSSGKNYVSVRDHSNTGSETWLIATRIISQKRFDLSRGLSCSKTSS